ncbi:MAG: sigma-70 family RNA polymerase sigma factor [Ignavibacteriaceae bacterium]
MEEKELVENIRNGDASAFRNLVDEYQVKVLNVSYRFVNNREDTEDIAQEVFIEVHRSIEGFRGDSKLSTWIYRITVSKSLDFLRMKSRKKRFGKMKYLNGEEETEEQIPASNTVNPEKELENQDRIRVLMNAIGTLSENQRVAFTLSKIDELSYKEIAEVLGSTISSVESLIHRAKVNLRKKLYNFYKKNI